MQPLPSYDSQFVTLFQFGNGYVRRHVAVDVNASDCSYLEEIAIEKAMIGMRVDIMPTLQDNDPLRQIIFPDAIGFKCPDFRINDILWEAERSYYSENINNLKHAVGEGSHQADYVIIDLSCEVSLQNMRRVIVGRFKDYPSLKVIEFRYKSIYTTFYK